MPCYAPYLPYLTDLSSTSYNLRENLLCFAAYFNDPATSNLLHFLPDSTEKDFLQRSRDLEAGR